VDRSRDRRAGARSALTRRLSRWLRPPRTLRPTRAGWCFFLITFGVGFAALNTGNNLLYLVLSLMLAFLVLSGLLSESALRGIRVERRLPREVFARRAGTVVLEIHNGQRRVPSFAVVVEDRVRRDDGWRPAGRAFALRVGAGCTESRVYRLVPERRGPLEFIGFQVSTRFPFGLFSKAMVLEAPGEAMVYPEIEVVRVPPELGRARGGGESVSGPAGHGADVSGLREFKPGDSVRRIHWRASLRRGEMLVRQVENEHEAEVEVRLATERATPGEAFETRVSWAASEAVAHLEAGHRVALRTDSAYISADAGAGQRARLLTALARVQPGAQAEAA
jgi:uncharacterized protein (DUF58 family)